MNGEQAADGSGDGERLSIGELAGQFGLATHVLRHWEVSGLLTPAERINGRRRYGAEHVARVVVILRGKAAGLSLAQLRAVLAAPDPASRRALLLEHHAALQRRIAQIRASQTLIEHVLDCQEVDFTRCHVFQELVQQVGARVPLIAADLHPRWG